MAHLQGLTESDKRDRVLDLAQKEGAVCLRLSLSGLPSAVYLELTTLPVDLNLRCCSLLLSLPQGVLLWGT